MHRTILLVTRGAGIVWRLFAVGFFGWSVLVGTAHGEECWAVTDLAGYTAPSSEGYRFAEDGFSQPVLVCFTVDGGHVTGTDTRFIRFGLSTLAGFGGNGLGNELFEVYQIDRQRGRLLFVRTRIGTATIVRGLPDVVSSFVGSAVKISD